MLLTKLAWTSLSWRHLHIFFLFENFLILPTQLLQMIVYLMNCIKNQAKIIFIGIRRLLIMKTFFHNIQYKQRILNNYNSLSKFSCKKNNFSTRTFTGKQIRIPIHHWPENTSKIATTSLKTQITGQYENYDILETHFSVSERKHQNIFSGFQFQGVGAPGGLESPLFFFISNALTKYNSSGQT